MLNISDEFETLQTYKQIITTLYELLVVIQKFLNEKSYRFVTNWMKTERKKNETKLVSISLSQIQRINLSHRWVEYSARRVSYLCAMRGNHGFIHARPTLLCVCACLCLSIRLRVYLCHDARERADILPRKLPCKLPLQVGLKVSSTHLYLYILHISSPVKLYSKITQMTDTYSSIFRHQTQIDQ